MNPNINSGNRNALSNALSPVVLIVPPTIITGLAWLSRSNQINTQAVFCSYLILQLAWISLLLWQRENRGGLPVAAMTAATYWMYFAVALYWGNRAMVSFRVIPISEDAVTETMWMALVGVACLFIGMHTPLELKPKNDYPDIVEAKESSWTYIRILVLLGPIASIFDWTPYLLGAAYRQIMLIIINLIPTVAFVLLYRRWLLGNGSPVDRPFLLVAGIIQVIRALAFGILGPLVSLGLTVAAAYVLVRRRIPWVPILVTTAAVFFLQSGKEAFRSTYWEAGSQRVADTGVGVFDRATAWVGLSTAQWLGATQEINADDSSRQVSGTLQRISLLAQVAHVLEITPSEVPFQQGQTYSYLAVTLIPRFLWPDKPIINEANRFYQITYGLSTIRSVDSTSISIGTMAEGYINFGWLGVIGIMLGIGVLLRIYEKAFLGAANSLLLAIGAALLPQVLGIEGQLGTYLGGLIQQSLLTFLIFLPITQRGSSRLSLGTPPIHRVRS